MARPTVTVCVLLGLLVRQEQAGTAEKADVCALLANPADYNHKLVEVGGVVSHGFENFSLSDPACGERTGIWLEYGGTVNSGTVYCCGVIAGRSRDAPLVVEGITVLLNQDGLPAFRRADPA